MLWKRTMNEGIAPPSDNNKVNKKKAKKIKKDKN